MTQSLRTLRTTISQNQVFYSLLYPFYRLSRSFVINYRKIQYDTRSIINANEVFPELIASGVPFAAGKIGSTEQEAVNQFMKRRSRSGSPSYPYDVAHRLFANAGVFPKSDYAFDIFCDVFVEALSQMDIMAVWYNPGELRVLKTYCPNAKLATLTSLEPYYHLDPWTRTLHNKKILIIHPFEQSIRSQYQMRTSIWPDSLVLPDFKLLTLKVPLSPAIQEPQFESWIDTFNWLKRQINQKEFDISLVGAGAYSLPLASYIKSIGKVAVHLGGSTQILFGIKGKRWDNNKIISKFYNPYWIRPHETETPDEKHKVERGCYW
jgi:hypothetical protein